MTLATSRRLAAAGYRPHQATEYPSSRYNEAAATQGILSWETKRCGLGIGRDEAE